MSFDNDFDNEFDDFDFDMDNQDFDFDSPSNEDAQNNINNGSDIDFGNTYNDSGSNDDFGWGDSSASANSNDDYSNLGEPNGTESNGENNTKRTAIMIVSIGIIIIAIVLIAATKLSKKSSNTKVSNTTNNVTQQQVTNNSNSNVGNQNNNVVANQNDNWNIISSNEDIEFNSNYSEMNFTVTKVIPKARKVSSSGDLEVIAEVQGSLSGVSGTYSLMIPYNKAVKLSTGTTFKVNVQLGTYSGKTVVGEIKY